MNDDEGFVPLFTRGFELNFVFVTRVELNFVFVTRVLSSISCL